MSEALARDIAVFLCILTILILYFSNFRIVRIPKNFIGIKYLLRSSSKKILSPGFYVVNQGISDICLAKTGQQEIIIEPRKAPNFPLLERLEQSAKQGWIDSHPQFSLRVRFEMPEPLKILESINYEEAVYMLAITCLKKALNEGLEQSSTVDRVRLLHELTNSLTDSTRSLGVSGIQLAIL